MSASELARLVGVTPTAVWNWEKNGISPRSLILKKIAKVLGVSDEFLLTGREESPGSEGRTLAKVIADARAEIANVAGLTLDRVTIEVDFS